MLRKCVFAVVALLVAEAVGSGVHSAAIAGQNCGGRRLFFRAVRVPGGTAYTANQPTSNGSRSERFYDSTGRWTGDGIDNMSTARPGQQTTNWWTQPQRH